MEWSQKIMQEDYDKEIFYIEKNKENAITRPQ